MTQAFFSHLHFSPSTWGLVFAVSAAILLWLVSLKLRDVSIVDIFWGPGVAGVVDIAAWLGHASGPRTATVLVLVNLWALRLAAHIWTRHEGEDHRYVAMRSKFGPNWWWISLVQVFLLQAVLIWFVPAPLVAAVLFSWKVMGGLDYCGIAVAALALIFEALADFQLASFRADPLNKGKVMDRGLWGWSRHPNYFGETILWWSFFAIGFGASHMLWLILSPLLLTFLLLQVSGIALMEDKMDERRPGYADYKRRVSAFVPWPPKNSHPSTGSG
jgi:steroid 5-alpha reductase family enzyme